MAKHQPKKQILGFIVRINSSGNQGEANWQQVGYLFSSRSEARRFKDEKYPAVTKFAVQAARVNVESLIKGDSK